MTRKQYLKKVINDSSSKEGQIFDVFIQVLIILSIVNFSLSTLPDLTNSQKHILRVFESISVAIFTVEYLMRLWLADNKVKFIFSFYGIIDLLAILPFYLSFGIDLRAIRSLRLLRLFRVLKITRYMAAIDHYKTAYEAVKSELLIFFTLTLIMIFMSASGIYFFENPAQPENFSSVFSSLWWAVITLTTVGYGDIYPITIGGKIFTFFILMIGLGIVAVPSGLIASGLSKSK